MTKPKKLPPVWVALHKGKVFSASVHRLFRESVKYVPASEKREAVKRERERHRKADPLCRCGHNKSWHRSWTERKSCCLYGIGNEECQCRGFRP